MLDKQTHYPSRFMDGSPVSDDYLRAVSELSAAASRAEEIFGVDELEKHASKNKNESDEPELDWWWIIALCVLVALWIAAGLVIRATR